MSVHIFIALLLFCFLWVQPNHGEEGGLASEGQLLDRLLKSYSPRGRPIKDQREALKVTIGLNLQQILSVDQEKGSITAIYWYNMEWRDEFLTWNSTAEEHMGLRPSVK